MSTATPEVMPLPELCILGYTTVQTKECAYRRPVLGFTADQLKARDAEWKKRLDEALKATEAYDDPCASNEPKHLMMRAHALCPTDLSHSARMAWIADYFIRNRGEQA